MGQIEFDFSPPDWVYPEQYDHPLIPRDEFVRMVERPESEVAVMRRVDPGILDGVEPFELYLNIRFRDEDGPTWVMPLEPDLGLDGTAALVHKLYLRAGGPEKRRRIA